jgi:hypothetical protein
LGKFWRVWQYVEDVGILYGHLGYTYYSYWIYFVAIWYIS